MKGIDIAVQFVLDWVMPKKIPVTEFARLLGNACGDKENSWLESPGITDKLAGSLGVSFDTEGSSGEVELKKLLDRIEMNRRLLKVVRKQLQAYKKNGKAVVKP